MSSTTTKVKTSSATTASWFSSSPRSSPLLFDSLLGGAERGTAAASATTTTPTPTTEKSPSSVAATSSSASQLLGSISSCFDADIGKLNNEAILPPTNMYDKYDANSGGNDIIHYDQGGQHHWEQTHSYSSEDMTTPLNSKTTGIFGNLVKSSSMKSPTSCATTRSKGSASHQSNKTAITSPVTTSTTTGSSSKDRHYVPPRLAMKTGILDRMTTSHPSVPGTPGGSSYNNASFNMTSAATGTTSVIANFWNNHASPATNTSRVGISGGGIIGIGEDGADCLTSVPSSEKLASFTPPHPPTNTPLSSPLSTSAKAAAEAVIEIISKAETFLVAKTAGVSSAFSGGLCSPRSSSPIGGGNSSSIRDAMGRITEDMAEGRRGDRNDLWETTQKMTTKVDRNTCCQAATNCLEFEEFGFNPFQDGCDGDINKLCSSAEGNGKNVFLSPSILRSSSLTPTHPQKPAGDEIRLYSSFENITAKKERSLDQQTKQQQAESGGGPSTPHWKQNYLDHGNTPQQGGGSRSLPIGLPFREVSVPTELERSVSELTMRSHGTFEMHRYTSDSRRMAYYAVGRVAANKKDDRSGGNENSKFEGNRRCYFSGKTILYGVPFYAGSVQQGPRTLVVFCLPSALDLPSFECRDLADKTMRERYLESLPTPDENLLREMSRRYREPFESLPVQVRSPKCWRLFVKFCFFSGLPIAEGEMHYRVKSSVVAFTTLQSRLHQQSEEIALSHDVMEAVNGEVSADMLRLPNRKVFDYLKRQYCQQCSKLNSDIFDRKSWEAIMPEV